MAPQQNVEIRIDAETGCAVASISAPEEGTERAPLKAASLEAACKQAGVAVTDTVRARLAELISEYNAAPRDVERAIAEPTPATDGEDGRIDWCEGFDPTAGPQPAIEGDRVDHYAGRTFIRVAAGTHVATLHALTPGVHGLDVAGKPIRAKPGAPAQLRLDPTLTVDGEGRVLTGCDGVLSIKGGAAMVTKLLEIAEHVDFSTGHIDFDGCVDIRQDVRDLFHIKATGGVSIGGLIEAATICCGGDFIGRRGMSGKGRGSLSAKGNAEIGFLNDTRVAVGGTLSVRREIINCDALVEGELAAEPCTMIGGKLQLRGRGVIGAIGSPSQRPTAIVFSRAVNLIVMKAIHPKVTLTFGGRSCEIDRMTKGPVRIIATEGGELAYRIADGVPRPITEIAKALRAAA